MNEEMIDEKLLRVKRVRVGAREMLTMIRDSRNCSCLYVPAGGSEIPADAHVVSVNASWESCSFELLIYHPSFPVLKPLETPPLLDSQLIFEGVRLERRRETFFTRLGLDFPLPIHHAPFNFDLKTLRASGPPIVKSPCTLVDNFGKRYEVKDMKPDDIHYAVLKMREEVEKVHVGHEGVVCSEYPPLEWDLDKAKQITIKGFAVPPDVLMGVERGEPAAEQDKRVETVSGGSVNGYVNMPNRESIPTPAPVNSSQETPFHYAKGEVNQTASDTPPTTLLIVDEPFIRIERKS